jgi:hypothetical protein
MTYLRGNWKVTAGYVSHLHQHCQDSHYSHPKLINYIKLYTMNPKVCWLPIRVRPMVSLSVITWSIRSLRAWEGILVIQMII